MSKWLTEEGLREVEERVKRLEESIDEIASNPEDFFLWEKNRVMAKRGALTAFRHLLDHDKSEV